ncbi:MAG: TnsA endonuclease N-terminal domain-containing protein [Prevotella sp.]|jgi:hypothetical protein|nr:TnsA endonuclease N-terminal domain-containing protein [Prevotella sp.]
MSNSPTVKWKIKKHRGEGEGGEYKPWIYVSEFNSTGVCSEVVDWKHHRSVQLLSQGEMYLYYILRWNDRVADIREQYPLNLDATKAIAKKLGYKHPGNGIGPMTTDMLVTLTDGSLRAYSVKDSKKTVEAKSPQAKRCVQILTIEKLYWNQQGISWNLIFKEDLNDILVYNIRRVVEYYSIKDVPNGDDIAVLKHRIAIKEIVVDMKSELLNFEELAKIYGKKDTD